MRKNKTSKLVQKPVWLWLAMTKLVFDCIVAASLLLPMDSPAKKRKTWDPQSPLKGKATMCYQGGGRASEVCLVLRNRGVACRQIASCCHECAAV